VPSIVKRISAPGLLTEIETAWVELYSPVGGVMAGFGSFIKYCALAVTDLSSPGAIAMAFNRRLRPTVTGVKYF